MKLYFVEKKTYANYPARSKAIGSEPTLVGIRAFESHISH